MHLMLKPQHTIQAMNDIRPLCAQLMMMMMMMKGVESVE